MAQIKLNATYGMTGTLPAVSGANLTTLNASNVSSGTLNAARYVGGKLGQVVTATFSSSATTSSLSYVDTGLTVDITPSATSSKVFVLATIVGISATAATTAAVSFQLLRDSTEIGEMINVGYGVTAQMDLAATLQAVDSPSSTSALTYKVQFRNREATPVVINTSTPEDSKITVFEILA